MVNHYDRMSSTRVLEEYENWSVYAPLPLKNFKQEDAMSDESFNLGYAYDSPTTKRINAQPDKIEDIITKIFVHLHSLADGVNREEIEAAILLNDDNNDFMNHDSDDFVFSSLENQPKNRSKQWKHFQRDTNFHQQTDLEQPVRTPTIVRNILSIMGSVLFGYEFFDSFYDSRNGEEIKRDFRSGEEIRRDLKYDILDWTGACKKYYSPVFNVRMDTAFDQAKELLRTRERDEKIAFVGRLTLYTTLLISIVGKLTHQKVCLILGVLASAITLIFMIVHYVTTSSKQSQLSAELKLCAEQAEKEAYKNRIVQVEPAI